MKGDFSRFTFDPDKHYVETLMQQGRVQIDADWNEQQAIIRHIREVMSTDVIGLCGAPKDNAGFAVGISSNQSDLTISSGHFYVDGILIENQSAQATTLLNQPYLPKRSGNLVGLELPAQTGRYLVYLEVWERHINADQDPDILEKALGGIDTATRKQIVWQAKLESVANNAKCDQFSPGWKPSASQLTGQMKADTATVGSPDTPCVIPAVAGYKGLGNQLYRVEIHNGGNSHSGSQPATFKWSRDNGSITTTVSVSGQTLIARDLGRDQISLGFSDNQWIEIIDERMELTNQQGVLLKIDTIDQNTREIKINSSTLIPPVDTTKPVIIRRWDNGPQATKNGIRLSNTPLILENGIKIEFKNGTYQSGDYWLIPARSAINAETGYIDWKRDPNNKNPLFMDPHGTKRSFCPLALVDFNQSDGHFELTSGTDCRPLFPALTDIKAEDVKFDNSACLSRNMLADVDTVQEAIDGLCADLRSCCTYVVKNVTDLQSAITEINSQGKVNAKICLQFGHYNLKQPLKIGGANNPKGVVILTGFGKASRLLAPTFESCVKFENCDSVVVSDLTARSGMVGNKNENKHLNGTIECMNCNEVDIHHCTIECAGAPEKGATCITVKQEQVKVITHKPVRIIRNDLRVGMEQVGVLVVNHSHVWIKENIINTPPGAKVIPIDDLLKNMYYRANVRKSILSHAQYRGEEPSGFFNVETITFSNNKKVYFRTNPQLLGKWKELLSTFGPLPTSNNHMNNQLKRAANAVILNTIDLNNFPAFKLWRSNLETKNSVVAAQGIVVTGSVSRGNLWIKDNYLSSLLQGIHVAFSRKEEKQSNAIKPESIKIRDNIIHLSLPTVPTIHPEAIFVGSYSSDLTIEANRIGSRLIDSSSLHYHSDGIKVHGEIGLSMNIRHNTIDGVNHAIRIIPTQTAKLDRQWLVADNYVAGRHKKVDLSLAKQTIDHTGNLPAGMRYQDLENRIKALEARRP